MAKKRMPNETVARLPKVYATVVEYETGAKGLICPECGKVPILRSIDYGLTSDNKLVWYTHLCPNCNLHVVHFSKVGGGVVEAHALYNLEGELISEIGSKPRKEREKKVKKLPKKVGKVSFSLPDLD